jgi:hypothetical protein
MATLDRSLASTPAIGSRLYNLVGSPGGDSAIAPSLAQRNAKSPGADDKLHADILQAPDTPENVKEIKYASQPTEVQESDAEPIDVNTANENTNFEIQANDDHKSIEELWRILEADKGGNFQLPKLPLSPNLLNFSDFLPIDLSIFATNLLGE